MHGFYVELHDHTFTLVRVFMFVLGLLFCSCFFMRGFLDDFKVCMELFSKEYEVDSI